MILTRGVSAGPKGSTGNSEVKGSPFRINGGNLAPAPRVTAARSPIPNHVRVEWVQAPGRISFLQESDDLSTWNEVGPVIGPGFRDFLIDRPRRFFRLRLQA